MAALSAFAQPSQINVSEDLVTLGIASQNAAPGNSNLDSRPLFQAAIQYASANGIPRVVADPGAYWFLTPQQAGAYLVLNQVAGVTMDLQGSDLYFQNSIATAIQLNGCQGVTLANFTVDYVNLPFTQVRLTGVSGSALAYQAIGNWPLPTSLPAPSSSGAYWGVVLRRGAPIANTGRLNLARPTAANFVQLIPDSTPWSQPAVLSTYQAGDVLVVTLRDGPAAILVEGGDSVAVSGVDIYASGTLGLQMDSTSNSSATKMRVMPRPGTDRLVSTNADGIQVSYIQANNLVQSCFITRTMDDGIALNSPFLAFVTSVNGSRSVKIQRNFQTSVPNGTTMSFLNPNTGETIGRYVLVSQNPGYGATSTTATYTFDQELPAVSNGFGLVYADATNRGQGSAVAGNIVEDVLFGRGIFLGGVTGVSIDRNVVRHTNCGGIVLHHDLAAYPSAANQNIQVTSNTVDHAIGPAAVGTGAIAALGSIFVLSTDANFIPLAGATEQNITMVNNYISNSGRSALWIGNVNGGNIQGNTIDGFAQYPQLAMWGISQALMTQLTADFTQAVVVHSSLNVSAQVQ